MTPKQQPTGAGAFLDDSMEMLIGHAIDLDADESITQQTAALLTKHAARIGLEISDDYIESIATDVSYAVGRRLRFALGQRKIDEGTAISKDNPSAYTKWLKQNAPDFADIITYEARKSMKHLNDLRYSQLRLQEPQESVKDKKVVFETQRIIEQAQAEPPPPQAIEHPAPETVDELRTVADKAFRVELVIAELRGRGLPLTKTEAEVAITGLHDIAKRSSRTAWQLGLHAVERGLMSQVELGKLLDTSHATVSRRYRENPDEAED
jgi:hypothetical protein